MEILMYPQCWYKVMFKEMLISKPLVFDTGYDTYRGRDGEIFLSNIDPVLT